MGMIARPDEEVCPHCGSTDLRRLVSRFRRGRTEDQRLDDLADRLDGAEPGGYREAREAVKEMGRALDDDASEEMEEMFEMGSAEEDRPE